MHIPAGNVARFSEALLGGVITSPHLFHYTHTCVNIHRSFKRAVALVACMVATPLIYTTGEPLMIL